MATETPQLVAMVRKPDPYQQPYDPAPVFVDPSAVVAMQAEGWIAVSPVPQPSGG